MLRSKSLSTCADEVDMGHSEQPEVTEKGQYDKGGQRTCEPFSTEEEKKGGCLGSGMASTL